MNSTECCFGMCDAGKCKLGRFNESCDETADCQSGVCESGTCGCRTLNASCIETKNCCSGTCKDGLCTKTTTSGGGQQGGGSQGGGSQGGGAPASTADNQSSFQCKAIDERCVDNAECCSGSCMDNFCSKELCKLQGSECRNNSECCDGTCLQGACVVCKEVLAHNNVSGGMNGSGALRCTACKMTTCYSSSQCCDGFCSNNRCVSSTTGTVVLFGALPMKSGCDSVPELAAFGICDFMFPLAIVLALIAAAASARTEKNRLVPVLVFLVPLFFSFLTLTLVGALVALLEIVFFSWSIVRGRKQQPAIV